MVADASEIVRRNRCPAHPPTTDDPRGGGREPVGLLQILLAEQQCLSAVEEFADRHDRGELHAQARYYSRLLPATPPGEGEQYGFEVDLDACSGCKACVAACHSLNGLDRDETWRDVGLLVGGSSGKPFMQHVTTACHHCLEPACLAACPVDAYEKDPSTGIVRHLDDQCFGCRYCTLACPYDVPKYNRSKGIVRKCDMCADRLAAGEAPACVQACPHQAIAVRSVKIAEVRENAEVAQFLPGAPESHFTFPTTTYKTNRVLPKNAIAVDYYSADPQHPHWPLIVMLVLTQLSFGAFTVGKVLEGLLDARLVEIHRPFHSLLALVLGLVALAASTLHLGRPQFAFRAVIGLRHSWLSREIAAFGLFAASAVSYSCAIWFGGLDPISLSRLGWCVVTLGAIGVFCSAMIYVFTRREFWNFNRTGAKFLMTAVVMGIATSWLALLSGMAWDRDGRSAELAAVLSPLLAGWLIPATACKLAFELSFLGHLLEYRTSPLKRSAMLLVGPLASDFLARLALAAIGGVVMPLFILAKGSASVGADLTLVVMMGFSWAACLAGELLERKLFFTAVSAPRMPGGPRP